MPAHSLVHSPQETLCSTPCCSSPRPSCAARGKQSGGCRTSCTSDSRGRARRLREAPEKQLSAYRRAPCWQVEGWRNQLQQQACLTDRLQQMHQGQRGAAGRPAHSAGPLLEAHSSSSAQPSADCVLRATETARAAHAEDGASAHPDRPVARRSRVGQLRSCAALTVGSCKHNCGNVSWRQLSPRPKHSHPPSCG